jgi:hypothetical protein
MSIVMLKMESKSSISARIDISVNKGPWEVIVLRMQITIIIMVLKDSKNLYSSFHFWEEEKI